MSDAIFITSKQVAWIPGTAQSFDIHLPNAGMMVGDLLVFTTVVRYIPGNSPNTFPVFSGQAWTNVSTPAYWVGLDIGIGSVGVQEGALITRARAAVAADANDILTVSESSFTGFGNWEEAYILVTVYRFVSTGSPIGSNVMTMSGINNQSTANPICDVIADFANAFVLDRVVSLNANTVTALSLASSGTKTATVSGLALTLTEFFSIKNVAPTFSAPPMPTRTFGASSSGPHNTTSSSWNMQGSQSVPIIGPGRWGIAHRSRK